MAVYLGVSSLVCEWQHNSSGLFMVLSFNFSNFVHDISLTSSFSITIGFNALNTIDFRTYTQLYAVPSIGKLSNLEYLWFILWSPAKGIRPNGRSLLALNL